MTFKKNARTVTLQKYLDGRNFRLSHDDRTFLDDLARVRIIDAKDADFHHYSNRKSPAVRRLDKLCEVGLLDVVHVNQPGRGKFKAYQFKTERLATLFGGKKPVIGRKRNVLHEVITSKLYFAEGRPDSFVVEGDFSADQKKLFARSSPTLSGRDSCTPDAMYLNASGKIVVIEADSGQYNKSQIMNKQAAWTNFSQVWGQPAKASARISDAKVHLFS